jgi:hypothetical protein
VVWQGRRVTARPYANQTALSECGWAGPGSPPLCFIPQFIVSNRTDTWYFANNNARHFNFNADERRGNP